MLAPSERSHLTTGKLYNLVSSDVSAAWVEQAGMLLQLLQ
jgi:hypothetical protein